MGSEGHLQDGGVDPEEQLRQVKRERQPPPTESTVRAALRDAVARDEAS